MPEKVIFVFLFMYFEIIKLKLWKLDRDAFDTLFDHAPEKLSLVENVISFYLYLTFIWNFI